MKMKHLIVVAKKKPGDHSHANAIYNNNPIPLLENMTNNPWGAFAPSTEEPK